MRAPARTTAAARRLRRSLSLPEVILWEHVRANRLAGLRFRRQHPIGPFVLDFYCPSARLCVEIDGAAHDDPDRAARDARRTAWLAARGIRVLRLLAADVLRDDQLEGCLQAITLAACAAPSTGFAGPAAIRP